GDGVTWSVGGWREREAKPGYHARTSLPLADAPAGSENDATAAAIINRNAAIASTGYRLCASNRGRIIQSLRSGVRSRGDECCRLARGPECGQVSTAARRGGITRRPAHGAARCWWPAPPSAGAAAG